MTFVTSARCAPILEHNPRVTRVIAWDPATSLGSLARAIRSAGAQEGGGGFTHRIDLHDSMRSRALRVLVGGRWTSYPNHRFARAVLIRTKRNRYRDRRPVAERYFDAGEGLNAVPDDGSLEVFLSRAASTGAERFLIENGVGLARQLIAVAPGAAHATKRWPTHHWVALAKRLSEQGNDVVVVGGSMDRPAADAMVEAAVREAGTGTVASAAGLDLPTTAALLKRCRALVVGDTGQMHLATAVGTPVVALFGPTVEAFGFFPYHAKATVLQLDLPCRPCSAQGGPVCPLKHHRCLQDLQPAEVLAALRKLPR